MFKAFGVFQNSDNTWILVKICWFLAMSIPPIVLVYILYNLLSFSCFSLLGYYQFVFNVCKITFLKYLLEHRMGIFRMPIPIPLIYFYPSKLLFCRLVTQKTLNTLVSDKDVCWQPAVYIVSNLVRHSYLHCLSFVAWISFTIPFVE